MLETIKFNICIANVFMVCIIITLFLNFLLAAHFILFCQCLSFHATFFSLSFTLIISFLYSTVFDGDDQTCTLPVYNRDRKLVTALLPSI